MHTQNPRSCGGPLPTHTSTGDAQTQFCLSLCGIPGSWCAPGLFEPSEHLCWEWGLILKVNLPLLPSYWGFSFALGCGASSHSHSSAYHVTVFFFFFYLVRVISSHGHCSWPFLPSFAPTHQNQKGIWTPVAQSWLSPLLAEISVSTGSCGPGWDPRLRAAPKPLECCGCSKLVVFPTFLFPCSPTT